MFDENADIPKALYILSTSPSTPDEVRAMASGLPGETAEEQARRLTAAVRSLPAGALAAYPEPERAQLAAGMTAAELLGY